ncbi:MAG TPA: HAD hydrolase family protein [Bacteroidota bacterium]|nr:HAD hydrolase family protein [Bacteroidota bacterium]
MRISASLRELLRGIKLVILDVDGVLTDGRMIYGSDATEYRLFDVHDGYGISAAIAAGMHFAIVSRGNSNAVAVRAKMLGITELHQGVRSKDEVLPALLKKFGVTAEEACFMGDDEPDLPLLKIVGVSAAPSTAYHTVLKHVDLVTAAGGGRGAVRELIDEILRAKKL